MDNKQKNKKHLPLLGVGPVIGFGMFAITALLAVFVRHRFPEADFGVMNIPCKIAGVLFIISGITFDFLAKFRSELFKNVQENKLITDGIYGIVRNPVYSAVLMDCIGIVLICNNLYLLIAPFLCWGYMTVFLINTEEKWLAGLYGDEYTAYCRKVNRCIPWFRVNK